MENRPVTDENLAEEQTEKYPNRFKPGQSGNPAGRPKRTPEEKEALEQIRTLAPKAAVELGKILDNPKASLYAKLQAIDIILNRTYGRPEAAIKLESAEQSMEASAEKIHSIVAAMREKRRLSS